MSDSPATASLPRRRWQFGLKHAFLLLTLCGGWFALARAYGVPIWVVAAAILALGTLAVFLALPGAAFAILGMRYDRPALIGALGCAFVCLAYAAFLEALDYGSLPLFLWIAAAPVGAGLGATCGYVVGKEFRAAATRPDFAPFVVRRQRRAKLFLKVLAGAYAVLFYVTILSSPFRWHEYKPGKDTVQLRMLGPSLVGLPTLAGCAAFWASLGLRRFALRLATVVAVVAAGLALRPGDLTLLFGVQAWIVAAAVRLARRREMDRGSRLRGGAWDGLPLTAAAVALAVVGFRVAGENGGTAGEAEAQAGAAVVVGIYLGGLTSVAAWAVLGRGRWWLRLVALVVAAAMLGDGLVVLENGRGPTPAFSFIQRPHRLGGSWMVVALAIGAAQAAWLWLWEFARSSRTTATQPGASALAIRGVSRALSGTAAVALLAALAVSPGLLYRQIVDWPDVPAPTFPDPNAFDELARIDDRMAGARTWNDKPLSERRPYLDEYRDLLPAVRQALTHESRVNKEVGGFPSNVVWVLLSEGELAAAEERYDDALKCYLDARQVCRVAARDGRRYHISEKTSLEIAISGTLAVLRPVLSHSQRERLIGDLLAPDPWQEPLERYFDRDRDDFLRYCQTWRLRLRYPSDYVGQWHPDHAAEVYRVVARSEAATRLLATELAIANYDDDRGAWPKGLADLVPEYLPEVPADPFGGRPLVYRRGRDSFVLYSVGPDETDDGGRQGESIYDVGDIVIEQFQPPPDDLPE